MIACQGYYEYLAGIRAGTYTQRLPHAWESTNLLAVKYSAVFFRRADIPASSVIPTVISLQVRKMSDFVLCNPFSETCFVESIFRRKFPAQKNRCFPPSFFHSLVENPVESVDNFSSNHFSRLQLRQPSASKPRNFSFYDVAPAIEKTDTNAKATRPSDRYSSERTGLFPINPKS